MNARNLFPVLLICCGLCSLAQNPAESPLLNQNPTQDGFSTHLAFQLTTPSGSHGKVTTGGGATLTVNYNIYLTDRWFFSPGIGAFYNTMGTDFVPSSDLVADGTIKNWGGRIPVLMGYKFPVWEDFSIAVATGPLLNISLYAKEQASPDFSEGYAEVPDAVNLFDHGFHHLDLQWDFFVGISYKHHYCIGISGGLGLTNVASMRAGEHNLNLRRNNVAFILSYTF